MGLPKKEDILAKAKEMAMEHQVKHGLPTITPEELELKESGVFEEARDELMRVNAGALAEQTKYLNEMAGEMRLKVIPIKELSVLKREHGIEWTNGWTKHEKKPQRVSLRKPLDIGSAIRGAPKPSLPKALDPLTQGKNIIRAMIGMPKPKPKPKKRHIQRTSKTMRVLRKRVKDGQKVFSFPDHIWKVRKRR